MGSRLPWLLAAGGTSMVALRCDTPPRCAVDSRDEDETECMTCGGDGTLSCSACDGTVEVARGADDAGLGARPLIIRASDWCAAVMPLDDLPVGPELVLREVSR